MFLFFFLMLYVIDVSRDTLYSYAMGRKKEQEPCSRDSKDFYQRVLKLTIILHDVQHFRFQTNKMKNDRRSWRRSSVNFNERMGKFNSIRKDIQLEKQSPFLTVRVSLIFLTSHSEYLHENSYPLLHRFKDHKTNTKSLNPYARWILEMRLTLNATVECFLLFFSFFFFNIARPSMKSCKKSRMHFASGRFQNALHEMSLLKVFIYHR